jgi:arylsulfatase A-like enzyme
MPRHAVVVLLDSLNRHLVGAYGSTEFATPNLDRLAARSVRFDRHVAGSLPCIPARHDLLCGALDFLWRPWGSIEVWEDNLCRSLAAAGVTSVLVSDHPHLFETGGENYHCDFSAWDYVRGHESDAWKTRPDPSWIGTPALPAATGERSHHYDTSRTWFREEQDFPGPATMAAAAGWLDTNGDHHDRFLLFVDEFDPHEPFDTPEPWASAYDPDWDGPRLIWPPYAENAIATGALSEREAHHLRANYGAKLSMIDHWLGRLLDVLDRQGRWDDTAVIVCTDHGHYLGERDIWGKPGVPVYEPMGRLPLFVAWPGVDAGNCDALTTAVDLHATLAHLFGVKADHPTHGRSLVPLLTGAADSIRDHALTGYWGRQVQVTDGRRKYGRAPVGDNFPLAMWSNRWSTMPIPALPDLRLPRPDQRAALAAMPGTTVPVIRQPFQPGDFLPYWAYGTRPDEHLLYDLDEDPDEQRNLVGTGLEAEMAELLRTAMQDVHAPSEQFDRLGLA